MPEPYVPADTFTKAFPALGYHVVAKVYSHWVEYAVYELIQTWGIDGVECAPMFRTKDDQWVTKPDEAEELFNGSIKWDGCSNWDFSPSGVALHLCGRTDAREFSQMIDALFDLTEEWLPTYDKKTAE